MTYSLSEYDDQKTGLVNPALQFQEISEALLYFESTGLDGYMVRITESDESDLDGYGNPEIVGTTSVDEVLHGLEEGKEFNFGL